MNITRATSPRTRAARTRRWLKVKEGLDGRAGPLAAAHQLGNGEGWHLVVKGDDEKIRNLLLGLTGLLI